MTVKIVTDSSADLPAELAKELDITVVPLYVRFGEQVYRDRVEIFEDEFYRRLQQDPVHPSTTQPTPQDFVDVYKKLAKDADGIVSIHISGRLSGTWNAAVQGREVAGVKCSVEIIDSKILSMGLGLIVISAAKLAQEGKSLEEITADVNQSIDKMYLLGLFDTLKYVVLGGRIGKAKALLGSVLNVKPLLTLQDGETVPAGQTRTRSKGIDRLVDFAKNASEINDLAVVYSTTYDEANTLVDRMATLVDREKIYLATIGPTLGVHMGPSALIVAFRGKKA